MELSNAGGSGDHKVKPAAAQDSQNLSKKSFIKGVKSHKTKGAILSVIVVLVLTGLVWWITSRNNDKDTAQSPNQVVQQYEKQLPDLKKAAQDNPEDANARKSYAVALYATGDIDGAMKEYEAAVKSNAKDSVVYNNLGNAYRDLNKIDKAVEAYKKAISLSPKLLNPYVNLANVQLYSLQKPADAIETYKSALKSLPDNSQIKVLLGLAYEQHSDVESAKQIYKDVLANEPNNIAAKANSDRLAEM